MSKQLRQPAAGDTVATIKTSMGDIKVVLFPDAAPKAVENFTTHAENGYYDGVIFHRVIPDFMIQGGDPNGNGTGGSSQRIKGEFSANGVQNDLKHTRGVLSMARSSAMDSASSQFFIMHADSEHLDGDYAAFGRVIEGMDVVDAIAAVETDANDRPLVEQRMETVRVETFGVDYGEPERIEE